MVPWGCIHWPDLEPDTQTGYTLSGNDRRLGEITGVQGLQVPPSLLPPSPPLFMIKGLGVKSRPFAFVLYSSLHADQKESPPRYHGEGLNQGDGRNLFVVAGGLLIISSYRIKECLRLRRRPAVRQCCPVREGPVQRRRLEGVALRVAPPSVPASTPWMIPLSKSTRPWSRTASTDPPCRRNRRPLQTPRPAPALWPEPGRSPRAAQAWRRAWRCTRPDLRPEISPGPRPWRRRSWR